MLPKDVAHLLAEQAGVVSRRQVLARALTPGDIARLLRRREWARIHPGVYVDHTGPPTWQQRAWAAVLHAEGGALCGPSAVRAAEGPGKRHKEDGVIHVAVARDRKVIDRAGVRVHRMVGLADRVLWNLGPPRLRYEDASLDVALEQTSNFEALAVLAGACQSRRTTARRLLVALDTRARVPRRAWLGGILTDVAEGTCSVLEHGYLTQVERPHRLPPARRQVRQLATVGVVYRDVEYDDLVVELDGRLFHDSTEQRDRDFERDLDLAVEDRSSVRLSYGQVFDRPCSTAAKLGELLRLRGWQGRTRRCPGCPPPENSVR